jgi:hypothetical protein
MLCACHDEPAYWNRDVRRKAGGFWRCAVKDRETRRRYYADPVFRETKLARQRDEHHQPNGGWLRRRRRDLRKQRERITEQLSQLEREATEC